MQKKTPDLKTRFSQQEHPDPKELLAIVRQNKKTVLRLLRQSEKTEQKILRIMRRDNVPVSSQATERKEG